MTVTAIGLVAASVLIASAVSKVASGSRSRASMVNLGFPTERSRMVAWCLAIGLELACAGLLILLPETGLFACAGLFALFAVIVVRAQLSGAGGRPCGCFGSRGKVSLKAAGGNLAVALLTLSAGIQSAGGLSDGAAVAIAFAVVTLVLIALAVAVVALAREVGVLKLALSSGGALEIAGEGPEVGSRHSIAVGGARDELTLAVFTSEGCPMCRNLGPSLEYLAQDPRLTVVEFDEQSHQEEWASLDIPGSPYAVAFSNEGVVLAKGTFNGLNQLESVVATAVRRREEVEVAA